MFIFGKIIILIDYLFIYLGCIKVIKKLKDKKDKKKTHSNTYEIYVFSLYFVLNICFAYYLILLLFIY